MEKQGDLAQFLSGMPIMIPDCNIAINQPSIKTIVAYGEDMFFTELTLFTQIEDSVKLFREGNPQLSMLSDFQLLIVAIQQDKTQKDGIAKFFDIILPDYSYKVDPGLINFYLKEDKLKKKIIGQLNPNNFPSFQYYLKKLFIPDGGSSQQEEEYNPANKAAEEIAKKLKRGNEIRQELKKTESKMGSSIFASYTSILSIGLQMDINILFNYTPFQIYDAFIRYTSKVGYDFYQKIATTPMMDVSKIQEPKGWMEDIYNNN